MKETENNKVELSVNELQSEQNEQMEIRREKLHRLKSEGNDPFLQTKFERSHTLLEIRENFDALEGQKVRVAGRLMSKRGMGKVSFSDLMDGSSRLQLFTKIDILGEADYKEWLKLDIGDIVGIEGEVMRTQRGEISIRNFSYTLLVKALRPLPEKFNGLKDTDTRYRQRYLDLIVNPKVKEAFVKRSKIITSLRDTLNHRDYMEVETPLLNVIAGGATARPFITHHNTLDMDLFLRIAPELYLKRLTVGGLEKVYEIGRNFRNEGMSIKHNPEFTLLELYEAYTDLYGMMDICETLISEAALAANDSYDTVWQGQAISLKPPYARMTMREAIYKYANVDIDLETMTLDEGKALAKEHDITVEPSHGLGDIFNSFFERYVEEKLIQPTFIYEYPIEISPLTKKVPGKELVTERFELFVNGNELANAYSELNDPEDQRARFAMQLAKREAGDDEASLLDEDYCRALEYGLPPTGGLGMGIDRLCMLLTGSDSIRDVLLFPTMKPLDKTPSIKKSFNTEGSVEPQAEKVLEPIDFSKVEIEPLFSDLIDFETFTKSDFRAVKVKECTAVPKSKKLLKFVLDDGTGTDRVILSGIHGTYEPEDLLGKTLIAITNLPPRKMMGIESCGMIISAVHKEEGEEKLHCLMVDPRIPAGAKLY